MTGTFTKRGNLRREAGAQGEYHVTVRTAVGRSKRKAGAIPPSQPSEEPGLDNTLILDFRLPNCETRHFCV